MCVYCQEQRFIISETEGNSRGVETTTGVSIVGNMLNVEKRKINRKSCMISFSQLVYGKIVFCPMCGEKLKGA